MRDLPVIDARAGEEMLALVRRLFPLPRSLTGEGNRATLRALQELIPLDIVEVPTGTKVLDWEVPPEWNIRDAWVKDGSGARVIDFRRSSLHVVGYSTPVHRRMTLAELRPHLHSDPAHPSWVPYRTSYYTEDWGFCLADEHLQALPEGTYDVCIDATLGPGALSYGELLLPGAGDEEVLVFTHICHPALANDNLSGIAVCALLARYLAAQERRYGYRFVFAPGTIGSLTWLARNEANLGRLKAGLVVGLLGIDQPLTWKRTREGAAEIDRVVEASLAEIAPNARVQPYSPWGYDERQFGSPGFALPVGRLTRACEEGYPEYHTSADNPGLLDAGALRASLAAALHIVGVLESNRRYLNTAPRGEPQLGRRGIYRALGGARTPGLQRALLWVLNQSDGRHDLVDIYRQAGLPFAEIRRAVELLEGTGLLVPAAVDRPPGTPPGFM
jgi:aminopeptidase-like protein